MRHDRIRQDLLNEIDGRLILSLSGHITEVLLYVIILIAVEMLQQAVEHVHCLRLCLEVGLLLIRWVE